jgi:transposase-like protein
MECPLCGHAKAHKHGKMPNGYQRYFCPACNQTFNERFDTLYYHRHVTPEQIRQVLQAHSEGSSLRGISRKAWVSLQHSGEYCSCSKSSGTTDS